MSNQDGTEDIPKFCSNCGNPLRPNVKFCTVCGKQMVTSDSTSVDQTVDSQPISEQSYPPQSNIGGLEGSEMPISYPEQTYQHPYYESQYEAQDKRGIVSSNIRPVSESPFMNRAELKIAILFGLTGFFSHFIRYLIIFNQFPSIITLLLPIPFYIILAIVILGLNKLFMRQKGVDIIFEADNYDYMVSSVFSSFFLSLMNYRFTFRIETSTIPELVYHPQNTKAGMQYLELPRTRYVGLYVRPQAFFKLLALTTLLGIGALIWYFQSPLTDLGLIARFLAMYLGAYGVSHLSPRVGRVNEEMATVGRFRTLFVFLIAFFIFLIALIGNRFFIVL